MESSFFEYRDNTDVAHNSDSEIENSLMDESFAPKKTPAKKNHTIVIPESDDTGTDGESDEDVSKCKSKQSDINIVCSSDDDNVPQKKNLAGFVSAKQLILSSSEDEESLPDVDLSKRTSSQSSTSFIGRKNKKRIMQLDSDTDNSIIIEHNRHKKVVCLKSTPGKINDKKLLKQNVDMSYESNDSGQSDTENDSDFSDSKLDSIHDNDSYINNQDDENDKSNDLDDKRKSSDNIITDLKNKSNTSDVYESEEIEDYSLKDKHRNSDVYSEDNDSHSKCKQKSFESDTNGIEEINLTNKHESIVYESDTDRKNSNNEQNDDENRSDATEEYEVETKDCSDENEDDANDDQMFMSRATRMSIMGIVPKENESDDSDYIESDASTRPGSSTSNHELPDSGINISQTKKQVEDSIDTSRISCSPFSSPLRDITNRASPKNDSFHSDSAVVDLTQMVDPDDLKSQIQRKLRRDMKENVIDDEVTIIDTKPEVIALSSDSEDDELKVEKSPTIKRSPKKERDNDTSSHRVGSDIKQYLVPASYPNQVLYVKKHVRENELNKLNGLKEDLQNVRYLLETMDLDTLPDGGNKLIERLTVLENEVRRQGDKVASMVVETEEPPSASMSKEDSEQGLSWDDIQKASNAVQPRMFGKQALTSHMAERNMILERLRDLYESLASRPPESELAPQPRSLASTLMPHQQHALAWLLWRETQRPCGGILADDMGLGKTITMISLIATDKEKNLDRDDDDDDEEEYRSSKLVRGGTLVVCPASLMQQWAGEVSRHCAARALAVCLHHGAQRAAHALRLAQPDLVLTTYNILQRESEKGGVLTRVLWRRVILDEAHAVRNHKSATSLAVAALRGRRRWALTGTPLHNKDLDLFALLKFLRCSPFDELPMWKKWIDNKSMGGQERLSTIMRCIMLRRTKQQLQQRGQLKCLPERSAHQCDVTLSKDEMNVYQKVLVFSKTLFAQFLHQRAERQEDAVGHAPPERDSAYAKMHKKMIALHGAKPVKSHEILVLLLRLRQVCCHCGLIAAMLDADGGADELREDPAGQDLLAELNKLSIDDSRNKRKSEIGGESDNEEEGEGQGEGTSVAEAIRSVLSPGNPVFQLQRRSSKIAAVMDCLNENVLHTPGEKAVVVSQWTSVLRLVERELREAGVECVTLSGSVPVPKRPPLIDALNEPANRVRIMLLSLCAGGVGLNLCGANHLLLLDPHWNPQLEEQAQDRIYRVGQTRHVHIYRFMCLDTVEQSIRKLQQAKLELAESVLTGAKHTAASKLTIEDLKVLFNMGPQHNADE